MTNETESSKSNPFKFLMVIPVPWMYILIYLIGFVVQKYLITPSATPGVPIFFLGVVLFILGAIIAGWGWGLFYKNKTTTVPGKSSAQLVTAGPYQFTRNPMYVGLALAYLGEAGMLHQIIPAVFLLFVILYLNFVVIPVEEAKLKEVFGNDYVTYCEKVRRWI